MLTKTLTAGILALSLALTSVTPTTASAQISDEDAIAGLIALLLLGAVVHESRNNDPAPERPRHQPRPRANADWRVLPAQCIRNHTRRNGNTIRVFGRHCTHTHYDFVNRLPQRCLANFRIQNGQQRFGYRVNCMRNAGFRITRH